MAASSSSSSISPARALLAVGLAAATLFFWDQPLLWPLKLLVVMLHETGHALATLAVGGALTRVTVAANESGACLSRVPVGFWNEVIVYSAGYVGSALAAGLLLIGTFRWQARRALLAGACLWLLTMGVGYGGDLFTVVFCLLGALAFGLGARFLPNRAVGAINLFLASFACVYAAVDLKSDLWNRAARGQSDATLLAELTVFPAGAWSLVWTVLSLAALGASAWYALGEPRSKRVARPAAASGKR